MQGLQIFALCVKSLQSYPTLCNPIDCNPPGSSAHGILQARILEWVAIASSRGSSSPRDQTWVFHIATREAKPCVANRFGKSKSINCLR